MQSTSFNAKTWMDEVLKVFESTGSALKGEDPLIAYNMQPIQISDDNFKTLIDTAITSATKFASTHINRSKKNKPNK